MAEWIDAKEQLPDNEVLAACFLPGAYGYKEYIIGYLSSDGQGGCMAENDHEILNDVTHWMHLPGEPGKETREGAKVHPMRMRDDALSYLYKKLKKARIALAFAESKPGTTQKELDNIQRKIAVLEWITQVVLKEE